VFASLVVTLVLAQIHSLRSYMDARFDAVDARFDAVDTRFDAVDARLDHLDRDVQAVVNRVFRRDE
jgi:hypothetical protein